MRTLADDDFDTSMLWLLKKALGADLDDELSSPRWSERGVGSPYNKAKLRIKAKAAEEVSKVKPKSNEEHIASLEAEMLRLKAELEGDMSALTHLHC